MTVLPSRVLRLVAALLAISAVAVGSIMMIDLRSVGKWWCERLGSRTSLAFDHGSLKVAEVNGIARI